VERLLDKGAAINARDLLRWTALCEACDLGHTPVVRRLLERGGDPTIATTWGWTPLMIASSKGYLEIVRSLLDHPSAKATINQRGCLGETALWGACAWGKGGAARALLESGADPTIATINGKTPTAVARRSGFWASCAEDRRECLAALEVRRPLPGTYCAGQRAA
jgi:uncharacterized protein